ncbi:MAG TPA: LysR family transcriptional regulator [Myxococcaceae bacterium]|nr:LysR family transcriptional regulator [Myxococcaceae bacterium]
MAPAAAARSLWLSLPAVSRQLSALERELGVPLVLRTTRRLDQATRTPGCPKRFEGRINRLN